MVLCGYGYYVVRSSTLLHTEKNGCSIAQQLYKQLQKGVYLESGISPLKGGYRQHKEEKNTQ